MAKQAKSDGPSPKPTKKKQGSYRRAFFTGLATLLPTILTLYILTFCYSFLEERIARPINTGVTELLETEPAKQYYWQGVLRLQDWELDDAVMPNPPEGKEDVPFSDRVAQHVPWWFGFILAVGLVLLVGFIFRGYIGRQLVRGIERMLLRVPVIKVIYPYAKQVTEFFFQEKKQITYESAVAIEYPRKGVFSLGFVTNDGMQSVMTHTGEPMVSIFIPSSPTPVTGYTVQVPKSQLIALNVTVDEAIRFTISGGVILPPSQLSPIALKTKRIERSPAPDADSKTDAPSDEGAAPESEPESETQA
ncbi:MAG: DUF502 domain-containing protein [Planctomycetota bacterium]